MDKQNNRNTGKVNRHNCQSYHWGEGCLAYILNQTESMSVKEELMPPNTTEELHFHRHTSQFFYILEGQATFILNGEIIYLEQGDSLAVPKGVIHQIRNSAPDKLRFLVISSPFIEGDRHISKK
ncbi:MAG: cupin domain-containing protein [Prolixibacteraceae bacterium]